MVYLKIYSIFLFLIYLKYFTINAFPQDLSFGNDLLNGSLYSSMFDERVEQLPQHCKKPSLPKDCGSATECTRRSGIYKIQTDINTTPFFVLCDDETDGGDWLVIQRRQDGSENFYRGWSDYENGFGSVDGEFFIGLKKLYHLTNTNGPQELMIIMEDKRSIVAYAKYGSFAIGDAPELYPLKRAGKFSGTAGNSLSPSHLNMKFTTKDRDNDIDPDRNCAVTYTGAWWYFKCHESNLNGRYGDDSHGKGINWGEFRGHLESLRYSRMMIRRSRDI